MADVSVWEKPALEGHVGPFEIPSLEVKRIDELFYGNPDTSHVAVSYIDLSLVSLYTGKRQLSRNWKNQLKKCHQLRGVIRSPWPF